MFSSEDENPPKYNEDDQMKYLQQTLKSINDFIMSLVMSYVGSQFKLLRMSWYRIMKPFRNTLKFFIRKYLCSFH